MLPDALRESLESELVLKIKRIQPVRGGSINHVVRIDTNQGCFCLKWNNRTLPGTFTAEAEGIALLAATQTIRLPAVLKVSESNSPDFPAYILMEWIESPDRSNPSMASLGERLAALHRFPGPPHARYGLESDNFIGYTPQSNSWSESWPEFFLKQRLEFQRDLALRKGLLSQDRRKHLDRLLGNSPSFFPSLSSTRPSLLHGDLWSGNILFDRAGEPVLIDPAVYYGDREAEIAFTELFGGFQPEFYRTYQAAYPLSPEYKNRRDLYNLYHLLNHLNRFGEMYGPGIDHILHHYVG